MLPVLRRLDRLFTLACHGVLGLLFLGLCVFSGMVGGAMMRDGDWPYAIEAEFLTPRVRPGAAITVRRKLTYFADCELHYEYRAQSLIGARRSVIFPDVNYEHPPMDLHGQWKTNLYLLPEDMTCGPAYFVEAPSAACNWFQRNVRRMRKPDKITHFEVVGCEPRAP